MTVLLSPHCPVTEGHCGSGSALETHNVEREQARTKVILQEAGVSEAAESPAAGEGKLQDRQVSHPDDTLARVSWARTIEPCPLNRSDETEMDGNGTRVLLTPGPLPWPPAGGHTQELGWAMQTWQHSPAPLAPVGSGPALVPLRAQAGNPHVLGDWGACRGRKGRTFSGEPEGQGCYLELLPQVGTSTQVLIRF